MKKLLLFSFALFAVQLSQAQWEHDIRVTDTYDTSYLNYTISHSITSNGDTVHIVWYEKTDNNWEIFYMRSTDGGLNWDPGTRLTFTEEFSKYPSVSVSGSSVYVVWEESIDGNREIFFIRSVDGGANWEEAVRLTEDPQISYSSCVIASNGSYIHLGWITKDLDQQTWKIYYKHSTDGGLNWSTESWLSPNSTKAYAASIAVSDSNVHFVWTDNRDGNLEIYYRNSYDNGNSWGPETRLTNDPALSHMPSIAASGPSVNVAWQDDRSGFKAIFYKGSTDNGENWSEDIQVTKDPSFSFNPNLAYSDSVLHLVYQNYSGYSDIYYNFSVDGGQTWHEETLLNDFSYNSQFPSIAVSGPALHIIWHDYRDFNFEIYYKRNPTGGIPVAIDENIDYFSTVIYPNPASRQLTVDSWRSAVGGQRSAVTLSIMDLYGREIKEFEYISSFPYQIDISGLRNGLYILRVTSEEGNTGSAKFLKIED